MSLIKAANFYIQKEIKIFPLSPRSKIPLTEHGFKDASDDEETIAKWWGENPNANIGMPTGKENKIIVIDIDPRNGGDKSARGLLSDDQRPAVVSLTGGDGEHWLYEYPNDVDVPSCKFAKGIDLKSDGGYIVLPPSIHPSGKGYRWESVPAAMHWELLIFPKELIQKIKLPLDPTKKNEIGWFTKILNSLGNGNRNDSFCKVIGKLHRVKIYSGDIFTLLKPHAINCGFPLDELQKEISYICQRYPNKTEEEKPKWAM